MDNRKQVETLEQILQRLFSNMETLAAAFGSLSKELSKLDQEVTKCKQGLNASKEMVSPSSTVSPEPQTSPQVGPPTTLEEYLLQTKKGQIATFVCSQSFMCFGAGGRCMNCAGIWANCHCKAQRRTCGCGLNAYKKEQARF